MGDKGEFRAAILGVNTTEFSGTYFQVNVHRIRLYILSSQDKQQSTGPRKISHKPILTFSALWTLTTILLIRLVFAVFVSIALPVWMDTFAITALELMSCTGIQEQRLDFVATLLNRLIWIVCTVRVVITDPDLQDAQAVVALKFIRVAGEGRTLPLITAVATVVITITYKDGRYAGLVAALELTRRTNFGEKQKSLERLIQNGRASHLHFQSCFKEPLFPQLSFCLLFNVVTCIYIKLYLCWFLLWLTRDYSHGSIHYSITKVSSLWHFHPHTLFTQSCFMDWMCLYSASEFLWCIWSLHPIRAKALAFIGPAFHNMIHSNNCRKQRLHSLYGLFLYAHGHFLYSYYSTKLDGYCETKS